MCSSIETLSMVYQRGIRIITHPIEAIYPLAIGEKFPYPDDQEFKSLSVERLFLYFADGQDTREISFPKGMRSFSRTTSHNAKERRFDAGLPFLSNGLRCALNFHLSYDIEKKVIDGYVDYCPSAKASGLSHIELEYHISFTPSKD